MLLVERRLAMLKLFSRPLLVVLLLAGVVLTGCGGPQSVPVITEIVPYTADQELIRENAASARYRLRVGDIVGVSFKYETNLSQNNIMVLPDGYINVKGLDTGLLASGVTVEDLDNALTDRFGQDIRNPALSVIVQEISDPEVYVMGLVHKPGLYTMPWKGVGVLQAISMAGGFDDGANRSETVIMRATDEGFMVRVIDLSNIQNLGFEGMAFFDIQPYDIIYVPRSALGDFAYITGALFGSALDITQFFWDVYALANLDKIDRIVR